MSEMQALHLSKEDFEERILPAQAALVDFWASWCGPCKMLSPIVDQIAGEANGFKVGKINVDDEPQLAARFNVMSIPTLMVFKNGQVANTSVGVKPKAAILAML